MCILLAGARDAAVRVTAWTRTARSAAKSRRRPAGAARARSGWRRPSRRCSRPGLEAVKIQPLASRLNISRTSFYWFFRDRTALLDALLEDWEAKNTGAFVEACAAYAETIAEGILNLITVFQDEAVVRAAPRPRRARLGAPVQGSDGARERRGRAPAAGHSGNVRAVRLCSDDADVRARTLYLVQIGYIAMQVAGGRGDAHVARQALRRNLLGPLADRERDGPLPCAR